MRHRFQTIRLLFGIGTLAVGSLLLSCGGGGGSGSGIPYIAPTPVPVATTPAIVTEPPSQTTTTQSPKVNLSVTAADPSGTPLSYEWRSTDGAIENVNSSSTTWELPAGPGIHFAYVLVKNGQGGYSEDRIAVSTDVIGVPAVTIAAQTFVAPSAPIPRGVPWRSYVYGSLFRSAASTRSEAVYLPEIPLYLTVQNNLQPYTPIVRSDEKGSFTFHNLEPGIYDVYCAPDLTSPFSNCGTKTISNEAINDTFVSTVAPDRFNYVGRATMADGKACGTSNEFFNKKVSGSATLLDMSGAPIPGGGPFLLNFWGHYALGTKPGAASVRLQCEGAAPVTLKISEYGSTGAPIYPRTTFLKTGAPTVSAISAKFNGSEVGVFTKPSKLIASEFLADPKAFLSYKGDDSRTTSCSYYLAIGAVKSCSANGEPTGAISFDDWKRTMKLAPFSEPGSVEDIATFVNRVDLDLTRNHHSKSNGANQLATYVCNHQGPKDETQQSADIAIQTAVKGKDLVACVAMDHSVTPGVNGDKPFTRFLIFGPTGQLLPSVNLDGQREKFAPGVCVGCHGSSKYAGRFPELPMGFADIGAKFLPFDKGNFQFSSSLIGLKSTDIETALHALNKNVLQTQPNSETSALIQGWYPSGGPPFVPGYLPATWVDAGIGKEKVEFYKHVYATSCRTCHVSFAKNFNFDNYASLAFFMPGSSALCGVSSSFSRNHSMPNALRPFELFWSSAGRVDVVDQLKLLTDAFGKCELSVSPSP